MADQIYGSEMFFLETGIKQEPGNSTLMDTSAAPIPGGMPIPSRRGRGGLCEFGLDLDEALSLGAMPTLGSGFNTNNQQGASLQVGVQMSELSSLGNYQQTALGPSVWVSLCETFKMDEEDDDILQVDKADLIQGPTLAELNANDETLLEDLSFDDFLLPEDPSALYQSPDMAINQPSSFPPAGQNFFKDGSQLSSSVPVNQGLFVGIPSPPAQTTPTSPSSSSSVARPSNVQQRHSTLHELLLRRDTEERTMPSTSQQLSPGSFNLLSSVAGPSTSSGASRLSSSAPTHLGLEQIWQRREPRQHLLSTGSLVEATGSTSSLSTGSVLSPASHDLSHDEGFDSEDDSDHYDDFSSDGESSDGEGGSVRSRRGISKKERYFWQYNVQAKGPKGQRLVLKTKQEDPHVLNEVTDPVFSPSCAVRGIKHSGKARKGDGNDLTPNPRKLHSIGRELDKLGRVINDMTPVSELPINVRPKSRKEKNKLASRACRLKKKAQHEANKIKLYGLELEHKRLIHTIAQVKQMLATNSHINENKQSREETARHVEKMRRLALKSLMSHSSTFTFRELDIAGSSTDFVNKVLEKVKAGVPGGGLEDI